MTPVSLGVLTCPVGMPVLPLGVVVYGFIFSVNSFLSSYVCRALWLGRLGVKGKCGDLHSTPSIQGPCASSWSPERTLNGESAAVKVPGSLGVVARPGLENWILVRGAHFSWFVSSTLVTFSADSSCHLPPGALQMKCSLYKAWNVSLWLGDWVLWDSVTSWSHDVVPEVIRHIASYGVIEFPNGGEE